MNTRAYNLGFAAADIVAKSVKAIPVVLKDFGKFIARDARTVKDCVASFSAGVSQATKDNVRGAKTDHDQIKDRVAPQHEDLDLGAAFTATED